MLLASSLAALAARTHCSFWVFGLLRPTHINLYPFRNARLHMNGEILEGPRACRIDASRTPMSVSGPHNKPVGFVLEIPGVIRRRYFGKLSVTSDGSLLRPVVTMEREVAVSSIVAAELPAISTPLQALAAQAVSARSFLTAEAKRPRHGDAQFCDTTHCQFLRSPAALGSAVAHAVDATRGMVLTANGVTIPAHYSAACGGHTDNAELDGYQYRSVVCEPCRDAGVQRRGHGLGLCQTGAMGLAALGWEFQKIVAKYYVDAVMRSV